MLFQLTSVVWQNYRPFQTDKPCSRVKVTRIRTGRQIIRCDFFAVSLYLACLIPRSAICATQQLHIEYLHKHTRTRTMHAMHRFSSRHPAEIQTRQQPNARSHVESAGPTCSGNVNACQCVSEWNSYSTILCSMHIMSLCADDEDVWMCLSIFAFCGALIVRFSIAV